MMNRWVAIMLIGITSLLGVKQAYAVQTVKVAFLDQLSGPIPGLGRNALKSWQYLAELANKDKWAGDVRFEIVPFDNKMSPQEALVLFNQMTSKGIRYVVQGTSSSAVGLALEDAVAKYNKRNPGKEVLYINYASQAPSMTNEKCSYWHVRTDAHSDMKIKAMVAHIVADPNVKNVYLLNPNYAYGKEVAREAKRLILASKSQVKVVGDDYHPTGQVKDYSPYISKIIAAKADTVITADFGNDLSMLVRAAKANGLKANFYTLNANTFGVPSAMGRDGEGRVRLVSTFYPSDTRYGMDKIVEGFKSKYKEDFINGTGYSAFRLLANAMKQSQSVAPSKVVASMRGASIQSGNGVLLLRAKDHQAQQPIYVLSWEKKDGKAVKFDQENTGLGWKPVSLIPAKNVELNSTCKM